MAHLLLCRHCSRYFRHLEAACPFCDTAPLTRDAPRALVLPHGAGRSRIHAARIAVLASAATFVACTDTGNEANSTAPELGSVVGDSGDGSTSTGSTHGTTDATTDDGTESSSGGNDDTGVVADDTSADDDDSTTDDDAVTSDDEGTEDDQSDGTSESSSDDGSTIETDTDAATGLSGGKACPGFAEQDPSLMTCRTDAECSPGSVCSPDRVFSYVGGPPDPCRLEPPSTCDAATCDGQCQPTGMCSMVCVPNCTETNCSGTAHCVDNQCVAKPCDAEGAQACSPGYACTPGAAGADAACTAIPCDQEGAQGCSEGFRCAPGETGGDYQGCVYLNCEEDGGMACPASLRCDPASTAADYRGCVQLSCAEPGGNPCLDGSKCEPTSMFAQQTGAYMGCAPLRCDDPGGPSCGEGLHCEPDSQESSNGCVYTSCNEGWACDPWRDCQVGGATSDPHGCADRPCTVDTDCGCGFCFNEVCRPVEPICRVPEIVATPYGCVWPDDEFV